MFKSIIATAAFTALQQANPDAAAVGSGSTRQKIADKDYDPDTGAFWFEFSDGNKVEGNLSDFPAEIQKRLALHGIMQKGGDSYASVKGNVAQAKTNVQAVLDTLKAGEWTGEREGGGPRLGEIAEAIAELKKCPIEKAREAVEGASDEERKKIRAHPAIKAAIAEIRSRKAKAELAAAGVAGVDSLGLNLG